MESEPVLEWLFGERGTGSARRRGLVFMVVGLAVVGAGIGLPVLLHPAGVRVGRDLFAGVAGFGAVAAYLGACVVVLGDRSEKMLRDLSGDPSRAGALAWACVLGFLLTLVLCIVLVLNA